MGFLELERKYEFSHEVRRGAQGASRAAPGKSGFYARSLELPFFVIGMKTDLFQSCGHCCIFQIFWHIEYGTFTASSFRISNSSTGIPSPPLALFVVMLSKAHLTSHYRMSGSR